MTSGITLELDHDGVRLLRRGEEGDVELAQVRLNDPAFAETLGTFQDGLANGNGPVPAEIVLPGDLVLFLNVGDNDQKHVETVIAEKTDCPLDTLTLARDGTIAAAVENTTLEEARAFAIQHGFEPTAFHACRNGKLSPRITFKKEISAVPEFFSRRTNFQTPDEMPPEPARPVEDDTGQGSDEGKLILGPDPTFQSVNAPRIAEPAPPPPQVVRARAPRAVATPPPAAPTRNEAEAFTVFGARNRDAKPAGFNRLHAVAAVLAAGVMLSVASLFTGGQDETEVVEGATIQPLDPVADTDTYDTAALAPIPEESTPPEPVLTPQDIDIEEIPQEAAEISPPSDLLDPVDLPDLASPAATTELPPLATPQPFTDLPDIAFTPPPPAGYVFDMDENGLVVATEDGALTPDGILVYARPPSPRPPDRSRDDQRETLSDTTQEAEAAPGEATVAAQEEVPAEAETPTAEAVEPPPLDIARIRPFPRPQRAEAPDPGPVLAVLTPGADTPRPQQRPASVERRASATREATTTDFDELARQAQSQTAAAGAAAATAPAPRAAAPQAEPEGVQNVAVRPTAPTRGSVADRATIDNALKLNRVNLIGVYGSSSDRRALVRLPSGRYVKVKVGDRVDGGRVAAIRESRLEYTKGGQRYALTLPNS